MRGEHGRRRSRGASDSRRPAWALSPSASSSSGTRGPRRQPRGRTPASPAARPSPGPSTSASARARCARAPPRRRRGERAVVVGQRDASSPRAAGPRRRGSATPARRRSRSPRRPASPPRQARHGAPVSPVEPPHTSTLPAANFVDSAPRRGTPSSTRRRSARCARLGRRRRPGCRCRSTVTAPGVRLARVRSTALAWRRGRSRSRAARTAAPGDLAGRGVDAARHVAGDHRAPLARPVDGRDRRRRRLARRAGEAGAEDRVDDRRRAVERAGCERRRRRARAAARGWPRRRPAAPRGRPSSSTSTSRPRSRSSRAATSPSPPLLPLPHTTAIRPGGDAAPRSSSASPAPARSISSRPGIPRSSIAHASSARCCIGVGQRLEPVGERSSGRSRTATAAASSAACG